MSLFGKKQDADNEIKGTGFADAELDFLEEDAQSQLKKTSEADTKAFDEMPSANESKREGGSAKKFKFALFGIVGLLIILIGLGVAVKRYSAAKEVQRIEQAEQAAQEQKKMANSSGVNIAEDQAKIQQQSFKPLPPPADANAPFDAATSDPYGTNATSTYQPAPQPAYIEPPKPTPRYAEDDGLVAGRDYHNPAPIEPPAQTPLNQPLQNDPVTFEPVISVKGANSNVLYDVNSKLSAGDGQASKSNKNSKVGGNLKPTILADGSASARGSRSMLLLKGTTIGCVLKTKIVSDYQGFTVCQVARDVYSADGKTLLLERGSQVFGEQNVDIKEGQARLAVLWNRIETPHGISVELNSPAAGQLGEMGIGADVNHHYGKRFGSAILLSIIQDAIAAGAKRLEGDKGGVNTGENNTNVSNTQRTTESMAEKVLDKYIDIPPTATVNQGTLLNILVVRDIDFADVYKLKKTGGR